MLKYMRTTQLPIRYTVDLCIMGASSAAVAAARAAAEQGRSVLMLSEHPYLGSDLCGTFRYDADEVPTHPLAQRLFGHGRPTPTHLKASFDEWLLEADIPFLFGCFAAGVLRNATDGICGVVVASRGGLFAVHAGAVIDATWTAQVARAAGCTFSKRARCFAAEQVVIGGAALTGKAVVTTDAEPVHIPRKDEIHAYSVHRYHVPLPAPQPDISGYSALQHRVAEATWTPGQQRASDFPFFIPVDRMDGATGDPEDLPTWHSGIDGMWLLGPCARIADEHIDELVKPSRFIATGAAIGSAIATQDCARTSIATAGHAAMQPLPAGHIRSEHDHLRGTTEATVSWPIDQAPLITAKDVVVMGGGTAGAPAAISAARAGADTLVCEYQHGLGGVGTIGMIACYYFGNRVGFTSEIDAGVNAMGPSELAEKRAAAWNIDWKTRWYQREVLAAGGEAWFGAIGCGVHIDNDRITGVLIASPWGFGLVTCKAVVDSTGNADIAAHAGAECDVIGADHVAMQGSGLSPRNPGHNYTNSDWTFTDDTDVIDSTQALVLARKKFRNAFDVSNFHDTRERRRIIGELTLSPLDFLAQRTFPDTIVTANSNFDTHGFTIHPLFIVKPPDKKPLDAHVPFRCLLPRGVRGVVCTGLGKSAHRDALPVIRMQPDVQNEGYAMGQAAARAARAAIDFRDIDIRTLQHHLVDAGILAEDVPAHEDSFPLSEDVILTAVSRAAEDYLSLATIFANPERALPQLRQAFSVSTLPEQRLTYAQILGMLGDDSGADLLAEHIAAHDWDAGWNYRGMGQYGASLSPLDCLIIALARSASREHDHVILAKLRALTAKHDMSHSRAIAIAVEDLQLSEAAPELARLLAEPGVRGHHHHVVHEVRKAINDDPQDNQTRNLSLREIHLARALVRCGDHDGIGQTIMEAYAKDLRGLYARHAQAVLRESKACVPVALA